MITRQHNTAPSTRTFVMMKRCRWSMAIPMMDFQGRGRPADAASAHSVREEGTARRGGKSVFEGVG